MRWKIDTLDDSLRQQLAAVGARQAPADGPSFFLGKRPLRALLLCTLPGAAATAVGVLISARLLREPTFPATGAMIVGLTGLAALWTLLLVVEAARVAGSRIRPFILITPRVILDVGPDHDYLAGHRLDDATDFRMVDDYNGVKFRGRQFVFTFPGDSWSVVLREAGAIRRLDQVLEQARGAGRAEGAGLELLPAGPDLGRRATRVFTHPFGAFWLALAGLLLVGLLLAWVGYDVYTRCVGRS